MWVMCVVSCQFQDSFKLGSIWRRVTILSIIFNNAKTKQLDNLPDQTDF